jgi:hypothetical protein
MFAFETTDQRGRWEVGLGSTASVLGHCRDIRFTPNSGAKADVEGGLKRANSSRSPHRLAPTETHRGVSLDQLIGAQQDIPANVQAEDSCRLEIDNKLEFDGLLNW